MMGDQKKLIFTDILCRVEMAELRLRSNNCLNLSVFLAIKCQNVLPDMYFAVDVLHVGWAGGG
jgi:hypothetical protein